MVSQEGQKPCWGQCWPSSLLFQPIPAPGPGSSSIPSTHTELCDHCTSAAVLQHGTFGRSKSPARTNLHHRMIDTYARVRKAQFLKNKTAKNPKKNHHKTKKPPQTNQTKNQPKPKKQQQKTTKQNKKEQNLSKPKPLSLFLLTETPPLSGQSFNILPSPAKPELTIYPPSALTYSTLIPCCLQSPQISSSPAWLPAPAASCEDLIPTTSLVMEALPGTWGSSSNITLFFPEKFGKFHTFPMQLKKDWAGPLYTVIYLNREGLDFDR